MKIRRVRTGAGLQIQRLTEDDRWQELTGESPCGPSPFSPEWELATADRHLQHTRSLLPFAPLSFRDYLLSEKHNINASRGIVKRFYPKTYRAARTVEVITRRPFPAFTPNKLFYAEPIYYFGNAMTIVPSGTPIAFPSYSRGLDFELELGWVLNKPLYNATPRQALQAIGAFFLLNDFSARDVQRPEMGSGLGPQKAKHFISSLSPTAVSADELLPRLDDLTGSVTVNGRTVSTVSSRGLQWGIGEAVAHSSRDEQLLPGEIFGTGTLPGGSGAETGHWLQRGDTLRLVLDEVGEVEHEIVRS